MTASKTRECWCARLVGASADLKDLGRYLSQQFEPFVVRLPHNNELVLRSSDFDTMKAPVEVRERALSMIKNLNGAMRACGSRPVAFGGVVEVFTDGTYSETTFVEAALEFPRFTSEGTGTTGGSPGAPQPSLVQKWFSLAATDKVVADMLDHVGTEPNFYDLYKTFEGIEALSSPLGGLKSRSWAPGEAEIERFTRTANYNHRHSLAKTLQRKPPKKRMQLDEATVMIRRMVYSLMNDLTP